MIARNGARTCCIEIGFGDEIAEQKLRTDVRRDGARFNRLAGRENDAAGTPALDEHAPDGRVRADDSAARNR